jgi:ribosomal protein S21
MKNYSNQIHKIKHTLGEIKNNIEKIQLVNKYLNNNIYNKILVKYKRKAKNNSKKSFQ